MLERLIFSLLNISLCILFCINSAVAQLSNNLLPLSDKSKDLERYQLTFELNGITQHALFIQNDKKRNLSQNLIVIAHGFHPEPPTYGRIKSGESLRPGDYYRQWVELYSLSGFNVLVPDYRGHNTSEGFEYTHQAKKQSFPEQFYAQDYIASIGALERSFQLRYKNIALVGHSMGSPIAFYAAQQIGNKVKVASLWSSAKYKFSQSGYSPQFVIHHGKNDLVTPIENSEYYSSNYQGNLMNRYIYSTDAHMLTGEMLLLGVKRDVAIFNQVFNRE